MIHFFSLTSSNIFLTAKLAPLLLSSGRKDNRAIYLGKKKKGRSMIPNHASRKTAHR